MQRINIDRGWEFSFPHEEVKRVNLPHDFVIATDTSADAVSGPSTGYYGGGIGSYSKQLDVPAEWAGKKIIAEFDGVMGLTTVGLNGSQLGFHPYGYTPFHVDLTEHVKAGRRNRLHVTANNSALPNSRWYSGGGIYRHVDLLVLPPIHITPWGIYVYTDKVEDGTAYVKCEVTIENETAEILDLQLSVTLTGQSGSAALLPQFVLGNCTCCGGLAPETQAGIKQFPSTSQSVSGSANCAAAGTASDCLKPFETRTLTVNLRVADAVLWDIDNPFLYSLNCELKSGDTVCDSDSVSFGIRTVSVSPQEGFKLNERALKLKGGCIHHDNGVLGAVSLYDSEYRKLKLHKDNGYNAVRCAHNPPSRDMLTACDRLGLLVINEAFDMWRMAKNPNDYHLFFEDWWERDMTAFITRDRNHPSVIIWSTGNEVAERGGLSGGYDIARQLAQRARQLTRTRFVTNALCWFWNGLGDEDAERARQENGYTERIWSERTEDFASCLDIAGYNYLYERYEADGKAYPKRVICGTESFPMTIDLLWQEVERLPHVIGDFTWTSFDYLGEAGIGRGELSDTAEGTNETVQGRLSSHTAEYPWRLAFDADFDICGFGRPQLAYRRIVWGSDETFIAVKNPAGYGKKETVSPWGWPSRASHWSWSGWEGKPVWLDVYSAAEEVEIFINGISKGKRPAGKKNRYTASFDLVYEPGELTAVSITNGAEVSRQTLHTAGKAVSLKLTADRTELPADGCSLAYITVESVDANGNRVPDCEVPVTAAIDAPLYTDTASLAGFGSAQPITCENYTTGTFTSYEGRLLAVVRAGYEPGEVRVTAVSEGLASGEVVLTVR
jgi:beta-galactosidase